MVLQLGFVIGSKHRTVRSQLLNWRAYEQGSEHHPQLPYILS